MRQLVSALLVLACLSGSISGQDVVNPAANQNEGPPSPNVADAAAAAKPRNRMFEKVVTGLTAAGQTELVGKLEKYRENFLKKMAPADRTGLDATMAELKAYGETSQDAELKLAIQKLAKKAAFAPRPEQQGGPRRQGRGRRFHGRIQQRKDREAFRRARNNAKKNGGGGGGGGNRQARQNSRGGFDQAMNALRYGGQTTLATNLTPFKASFTSRTLPTDTTARNNLKTYMTQAKVVEAATGTSERKYTLMKRALRNLMKIYQGMGGTYN